MLELITCHQGMNESIESVTWLNHLGSFTFLAMLSGLEFWRAAEILHPAVVGDACHPFHHKQGGHWKKKLDILNFHYHVACKVDLRDGQRWPQLHKPSDVSSQWAVGVSGWRCCQEGEKITFDDHAKVALNDIVAWLRDRLPPFGSESDLFFRGVQRPMIALDWIAFHDGSSFLLWGGQLQPSTFLCLLFGCAGNLSVLKKPRLELLFPELESGPSNARSFCVVERCVMCVGTEALWISLIDIW